MFNAMFARRAPHPREVSGASPSEDDLHGFEKLDAQGKAFEIGAKTSSACRANHLSPGCALPEGVQGDGARKNSRSQRCSK